MNRAITLICVAIVFVFSSLLAQPRVQSNREFLLETVDHIAEKVMDHLKVEPSFKIKIDLIKQDDPVAVLLLDRFIKKLKDESVLVFIKEDTADIDMRLSLLLSQSDLQYQGCFSLKSGKEKMTKRDAKTGFSIRAEEIRTGEVVWVGEICHTMSDTVLISELESLESDKCIQKPIHPSCGGVRKWLEPVLMVFTTGIVAYLFYTVRSN